jgi:hypothetical protein
MTAPDPWMVSSYKFGWTAAMAKALTLAVKFGPDNDYRLRRALLDAMDECPDLNKIAESAK